MKHSKAIIHHLNSRKYVATPQLTLTEKKSHRVVYGVQQGLFYSEVNKFRVLDRFCPIVRFRSFTVLVFIMQSKGRKYC